MVVFALLRVNPECIDPFINYSTAKYRLGCTYSKVLLK